jgi:hypothetical protein
MVDEAKRQVLIQALARAPEPQMVPVGTFFDGNDDQGSIGCNLNPHPGIDTFRRILTELTARDDVTAVYASISELDPGFGSWPFTDVVVVVGSIAPSVLAGLLAPLQPDEVLAGEELHLPGAFLAAQTEPVLGAWWD